MDLYNVKSAVFELDWEGASLSALGNRKRWVIKIGDRDKARELVPAIPALWVN